MKRLLLLIVGLCIPFFAFADNGVASLNIFTPSAITNGTDLSISYLGDMFGVVDGVLHGSGSQVMGQMFMIFNAGALILGGIIAIYTSLISLLNTAHEGEFLGRKWNSIWIPLRTVLGIALLIPKATGYCAIQIFMMWVIVQGVGLADTVWNQVTNYLVAGGVLVQQSLVPNSNVSGSAQDLFRQSVCLASLQDQFNNAYQQASKANQSPPTVPNFLGSINPLLTPGTTCPGNQCSVPLPNFAAPPSGSGQFDWSKLNGACGTVSWTQLPQQSSSNSFGSATLVNAYEMAIQTGVQQILLDMSSPAQSVVNFTIDPPNAVSPQTDLTKFLNNRMFLDAAEDYQGIVYPAQRVILNVAQEGIAAIWSQAAERFGWIDAGAFYQLMASQDNSAGAAIFTAPSGSSSTQLQGALNSTVTSSNVPSSLYSYIQSSMGALQAQMANGSALNTFISQAPTTDATYGGTLGGGTTTAVGGVLSGVAGVGGTVAAIANPLIEPLIDIVRSFIGLVTAQATNANPVVLIALMGVGLIGLVVEIWITGAITIAVATGLLAAIPCVSEGTTMDAVVEWIVPFIWGICGLLFVEGVVMAYYVPMIPFILFLFGAIGWLISTLEAMVAAPLVALGITHPEGAEVLGKSDPAVLLLVNVFLRPSMMIIGFIGGIILSYVGVWLLNVGFFGAFVVAVFQNFSLLNFIFAFPAMLILYVGLVIGILNYSFSLINVVPDKVLRWIGGQVEGIAGEAGRMLGESKQGLSQAAQGTAQGMSDLAKAAGQRGDKERDAGGDIKSDGKSSAKGGKSDSSSLNVAEKK